MTRSDILRIVVVGVAGSFALLAITLPLLGIAPASPLMQIWPTGALNRVATAAELITPRASPATLAAVAATSRDVLSQEPVNVIAARNLGLVASVRGDQTHAARLLNYAEKLSRRDKLTQLALIELNVGFGSIGGALRHYDRVLRTSPELRDVLLPVLRGAAHDANVAPQLAEMIARRPLWWAWFINSLVNDPADSSRFLAMTARRMRPNINVPVERNFLASTIGSLVTAGEPNRALAIYRSAMGGTVADRVRDGGFERTPVLPPLDWQLVDQDGFGATREPADNGNNVLKLNPSLSQSGTVARQFLVLQPGTYRVILRAGDIERSPGVDPVVRLSCAGGGELVAYTLDPAGGRLSSDAFIVPAQCGGQWLEITIKAPELVSGSEVNLWVDDLAIVPARVSR